LGTEPPPALKLRWRCLEYQTLPKDGGYLDQDAALMAEMTALGNVYDTVRYLRGLKGAEIHRLTHSQRRLLGYLRKEGFI